MFFFPFFVCYLSHENFIIVRLINNTWRIIRAPARPFSFTAYYNFFVCLVAFSILLLLPLNYNILKLIHKRVCITVYYVLQSERCDEESRGCESRPIVQNSISHPLGIYYPVFLSFFLYQIRRGVRDARKKLQSKDFSWLKKKLRRTFAYYNTNMLQ